MLAINFIPDDYCQGVVFEVTNVAELAKGIATALVQEYSLARDMINGAASATGATNFQNNEIEDIIARRLYPADVFHRDGFLFQVMMWLASHLDLADGDLVALPHAQASAKGQDCIIVHRTKDAPVALT